MVVVEKRLKNQGLGPLKPPFRSIGVVGLAEPGSHRSIGILPELSEATLSDSEVSRLEF